MRHAYGSGRPRKRRATDRIRPYAVLVAVIGVFTVSGAGIVVHRVASGSRENPPAGPQSASLSLSARPVFPGQYDPDRPPAFHRMVYRYSVVEGGVASGAEVLTAIKADGTVADHYRGFDPRLAKNIALPQARLAYVSYRVGNRIGWTRKQVELAQGERVITDGKNLIRARCGNRISDTPVASAALLEAPEIEIDKPILPGSGFSIVAEPIRPYAPQEEPREAMMETSPLSDKLNLVPDSVLYPGGIPGAHPGNGIYPAFFVNPGGGGYFGGGSNPVSNPDTGGGTTPGGGSGGGTTPGGGSGGGTTPGGGSTPGGGGTTPGGGGGTTPGGSGETTPGGGGGTTPGGGGGTTPGGGGGTTPGGGGGTTPGGGGGTTPGGGGGTTPGGGGGTTPGGGGGTTPGGGGETEPPPTVVPEPGDFALIGAGLVLLGLLRAKRSVSVDRDGENFSAAARR
jgi:hypothetical protein